MSSAIHITYDEEAGVRRAAWDEFCHVYGIVYSPRTIGQCIFYSGEVEVCFGEWKHGEEPELPTLPDGRLDFAKARAPEYAERVRFSTYWGGAAGPRVAELARAWWTKHGGAVQCDPELRLLFVTSPGMI